MPETLPFPPSLELIPSPPDLRLRLAVALREVDLLRRLIRVAEYAARFSQTRRSELDSRLEVAGR